MIPCLGAGPWGGWVWLQEPFKSGFSDGFSLVGLLDVSPVGFQSYIFCGLVSQVYVLKVEMPYVVLKPFAPQGEALEFEFPPSSRSLCQGWGLWQDYVPAFPTSLWVSSQLPNVQLSLSQPLGFFKEAINCSICSYRLSVSVGGGEFRVFLSCHLENACLVGVLSAYMLTFFEQTCAWVLFN